MSSALKKLNPAISTVALCVALLALVASAAGVGYAAGQIGTNGIKNNAITTKKIKNNAVKTKKIKNNAIKTSKIKNNAVTGDKILDGTVTGVDLAPQEAQRAPTFSNGGEGDCVWQNFSTTLPTGAAFQNVTFRLDRNNRVILTGIAVSSDGAGGDAACDPGVVGQISDGIAFTLPAGYIPAKSQYLIDATVGLIFIVGAAGYTEGATTLAPGTVFAPDGAVILDNVSFDPAGSNVAIAKTKNSGSYAGSKLQTGAAKLR